MTGTSGAGFNINFWNIVEECIVAEIKIAYKENKKEWMSNTYKYIRESDCPINLRKIIECFRGGPPKPKPESDIWFNEELKKLEETFPEHMI